MNLKVYGYTGWYAMKPKVKILFEGDEIGQVGYNETFEDKIEEDGELEFKCNFRKATVKVYRNRINVIHIEFDRFSGKLVAESQYSEEEKTSSKTFKCSECGKEVPEDAQLCPYCGERFED